MPRPKQCRRVCRLPNCTYFKPAGIPMATLEEVVVAVDELEAMRLVDIEKLYHEQAAEQMGVSRRTFGRIIDSARTKVTQALLRGTALRIEGGTIEMAEQQGFRKLGRKSGCCSPGKTDEGRDERERVQEEG